MPYIRTLKNNQIELILYDYTNVPQEELDKLIFVESIPENEKPQTHDLILYYDLQQKTIIKQYIVSEKF